MKKISVMLVLFMMLFALIPTVNASVVENVKDKATTISSDLINNAKQLIGSITGNENIKIYVDGSLVAFPDQKPYIDQNNRTMVPVRFVSEALGAKVDWNGAVQEVTVHDKATVKLKIGQKQYTIDGVKQQMDTEAVLTKQNRTMVPMRFISEGIGVAVDYRNIEGVGLIFNFTRDFPEEKQVEVIEKIVKEIEKELGIKDEVQPTGTRPRTQEELKNISDEDIIQSDLSLKESNVCGLSVIAKWSLKNPGYEYVEKQYLDIEELLTKRYGNAPEVDEIMGYLRSKTDPQIRIDEKKWTINGNEVYVGDSMNGWNIYIQTYNGKRPSY